MNLSAMEEDIAIAPTGTPTRRSGARRAARASAIAGGGVVDEKDRANPTTRAIRHTTVTLLARPSSETPG